MFNVLALIPLAAPPNALNGFAEAEPNEPNEAGENAEGGAKAAPNAELLDIEAIGDRADIALIGLENDIPGKPDIPPKPAWPNPSLSGRIFIGKN